MAGDLHCHTRMSDGSAGIEEVIHIAKRRGLTAIAITDHDTHAGATRAEIIGKRVGLNVIPGAEVSAYDYKRNRKVHILSYLCDSPNRLEGLFKQTGDNRRAANQKAAETVIRMYPISGEMIMKRAQGSTNVYKQHIMHALIDSGCTSKMYGKLYQSLFGKDGVARQPISYPDVFEVLKLIHEAGGIAVLAHTKVYDSFDLLPELADAGLDGVEVWHPAHDEETVERLREFAVQRNMLMTGGTDFHGMYSDKPTLVGTCTTPDDQLDALLNYKAKRARAARKSGE